MLRAVGGYWKGGGVGGRTGPEVDDSSESATHKILAIIIKNKNKPRDKDTSETEIETDRERERDSGWSEREGTRTLQGTMATKRQQPKNVKHYLNTKCP